MTYPASDVSTTDMDAGTDSPATARTSLLDLVTKFNQLRNHISTFVQTFLTMSSASAARANLGSGAVGDALFLTATAAAARSAIGALAAGDNVGSATATTPTATDTSTRVATTAMVQAVGFHGAGFAAYNATATLSQNDIGRLTYYNGASAGTLTLPTSPAVGSVVAITNIYTGLLTVAAGGAESIYANGSQGTPSMKLSLGESVVLEFIGATWIALASHVRPNSMVRVASANGYGSTNTAIRRYSTTVASQGPDITYADSATLGGSFTVNADGMYMFTIVDQSSGVMTMGISKDTTTPATSITGISASERLVETTTVSGASGSCSVTVWLAANSVIRAHTDGSAASGARQSFTAVRVGS